MLSVIHATRFSMPPKKPWTRTNFTSGKSGQTAIGKPSGRNCICNQEQCDQVPEEMCQLISVPRKIGTKGTEPGREIFTAAHLEKWCYSYLGYQKISKDSVGKVQKLMEIWDKSSTSRLIS